MSNSAPQIKGVALITGAAFRIGRTLSKNLAAKGWAVGIHYRRSEKAAKELADEISADGGTAATLQADLAQQDDVQRLIHLCQEKLGTPTCLINNASEFHEDDVRSTTPELWHQHLDVNVKAPVFLSQAFAHALGTTRQGNIINIIDQRVWRLKPEFFTYSISKSALWSATQLMAQMLSPNIRVNAIGPGPTLQSVHQKPEDFAQEYQETLLQRATEPDEIAHAVFFILNAPAMTGQMIALDSGQHLS